MIKVLLVGASGRMGMEILSHQKKIEDIGVIAGFCLERGNLDFHGGSIPLILPDEVSNFDVDVIIDFSLPEATETALKISESQSLPILIATTGLGKRHEALIDSATNRAPVLISTNTSIGVNAMMDLVSHAAELLDEDWDVEIVETHHGKKIDAPSGTAITLAEVIAGVRGHKAKGLMCCGRNGKTGERPRGEIGIHSLRGGSVSGDHSVYFLAQGQRIEITFRSENRSIYAEGALNVAKWLVKQPKGLYEMKDFLRDFRSSRKCS